MIKHDTIPTLFPNDRPFSPFSFRSVRFEANEAFRIGGEFSFGFIRCAEQGGNSPERLVG
jgi:hypothetical protein